MGVGTVGFAVGLVLSTDCIIHCREIQILVCCDFFVSACAFGEITGC